MTVPGDLRHVSAARTALNAAATARPEWTVRDLAVALYVARANGGELASAWDLADYARIVAALRAAELPSTLAIRDALDVERGVGVSAATAAEVAS